LLPCETPCPGWGIGGPREATAPSRYSVSAPERDEGKRSQTETNYRPTDRYRRCWNCGNFRLPSGCAVVEGTILAGHRATAGPRHVPLPRVCRRVVADLTHPCAAVLSLLWRFALACPLSRFRANAEPHFPVLNNRPPLLGHQPRCEDRCLHGLFYQSRETGAWMKTILHFAAASCTL
jgi:hypothetical protein